MRDALLKLSHLHFMQQATERQHAENYIALAKKMVDGVPTTAHIDIDGQSTWAGNTPKWDKDRTDSNEDGDVIENRNIGARIVCGPIDRYISISTNNTIPKGANVMVETMRYCIQYLARSLQEFHLRLPRTIGIQFDNSGENKVCNDDIKITT